MDNSRNNFVPSDIANIQASIGIIQSTIKTHGESVEKINSKIIEYNDSIKQYVTSELDRFSEHILPPIIKLAVLGGIQEHVKNCNKTDNDIKLAVIGEKVEEASKKIDILKNEPTNKIRKMAARGEISLSDINVKNSKYDDEIKVVIPKKIIKWAIATAIFALLSLLGVKGIGSIVINPGNTKISNASDSEAKADKMIMVKNGK
jgi:hypothetical protein